MLFASIALRTSGLQPGLSQIQLQKSLEQYQRIPKSVVVQHKIGVRMINVKDRTKYHLQNELN